MNSAHYADEIKTLKDRIASLEQENTSLKKFFFKTEKFSPPPRNFSKENESLNSRFAECEGLIRKLFIESSDGIILWEPTGKIAAANDAACGIFGLSRKELLQHKIPEFSLIKDGGQKGRLSLQIHMGEKKHFEYKTHRDMMSGYRLTLFRDITEKVEMEDRLGKSDTLNMIGELAAGIAHEIRNPMTALKGFIQLLESSTEGEYSLYFQVITSELQRIDSIINEFLILSKPQAIKYVYTDLVKIMKETVDLLTAQAVLDDVQFTTHYDDALPELLCEPNQLKKVFINIIKNAIEVMPNGGYITISISQAAGERIHISIKDEGEGIPEDKLAKLGEPFFTTKEKGTGLGLMVSYKIIKEHGGTIEVESEVGHGTVFHIYLPIK